MISIDSKVGLDPRLPNNPVPTTTYMSALHWRLTEVLREHAQAINGQELWTDLVSEIVPNGIGTAATYDTTTYPGTLLFSGTADRYVSGIVQLPHSWKEGSAVKPHIHWTKTTADAGGGAVSWEMRWAGGNIGAGVISLVSWTAHTLAYGDLTSNELHNVSSFPDLALSGGLASYCILWELRRLGSTDAYGSNTRLLSVDFHYQMNSDGSRLEYMK